MSNESSASALSPAAKDMVPLKLHFADDGCLMAATLPPGSDACSGADPDHSDYDEDLTSQDLAAQSLPVECDRLPPGLGPPPGLGMEDMGAAAAKRTPLRSQATAYSPLRSYAEVFVPKGLALAGGTRVSASKPGAGTSPKAPAWTTVMMRNVPLSYTCDSLIDLLEFKGFAKWFDFVYVPINFTQMLVCFSRGQAAPD